jgi:hypothetical protein
VTVEPWKTVGIPRSTRDKGTTKKAHLAAGLIFTK